LGIGGWEVLVILFVVLLVFGPKKIPEVARGIGRGMRELRRISTDFQREMNLADLAEEPKEKKAPAAVQAPAQARAALPASSVSQQSGSNDQASEGRK
jgi:TatA/E family protein of Tat protein translocase